MKITYKKAKNVLKQYSELRKQYSELRSLAEEFARSKDHTNNIRFDEYGNIEEYVNTACNCHPEYYWEEFATFEEFGEWLDNNQS